MDNYKIYPKQFRSSKIPIEKNRCFILMPFKGKFDIIYGNIKKALNDNGYICNRADEIIGSKPIMNKILSEILKSHYIIADLTDQNANVFYELGVAHTFKDSQNIILLAQKKKDIPFDINHINTIIYDETNIKYLTSNILQCLEESKYLYGFYEALQYRNIIGVIRDDNDEVITWFHTRLGDQIPIAIKILYGELGDISTKETEKYFLEIINCLNEVFSQGASQHIQILLKILTESLILCSNHNFTDKIVYDFLFGNLLTPYTLDQTEETTYKIDLAISLASAGSKVNVAMNWLVDYFSRSKSASIDLNRYKIERFFMVTNDRIINNIIIDSLFHENCYIREHLADIVGEKKLYDAGESLLKQLVDEENYFTMVSIVSAIGKLKVKSAANAIIRKVEEEKEEIIKTKQFFVLKHCRIALSRLSGKSNVEFLKKFDKKYGKYIENYFIL